MSLDTRRGVFCDFCEPLKFEEIVYVTSYLEGDDDEPFEYKHTHEIFLEKFFGIILGKIENP